MNYQMDREAPLARMTVPLYGCPNCDYNLISIKDCICGGTGKVPAEQMIKAYGLILYDMEIPYCHICLNKNRHELFPYSVVNFGSDAEANIKFVYRCCYSHGHDQGWELVNVLTGMPVHL